MTGKANVEMTSENILGQDDRPRFFSVGHADRIGVRAPDVRRDVALRTVVRSLAGMQKEAVIVSSAMDVAWRLVSDEGPYLAGHDEAPFPLAFLSAGMVASYFTETVAAAEQHGVSVDGLRLTLDNFYTMEGSAVRGTMTGGALAPELKVEFDRAPDGDVRALCADAVHASPLNGLLRGSNTSRFSLTQNGEQISPDRVAELDGPALDDPAGCFDDLAVGGPEDPHGLLRRSAPAEQHDGEGGAGSSLRAEQKRTLHVRSVCTERHDGVKAIEIQLFKPSGSSFHLLSAEPSGRAAGRAPDAATLISAGIGFCFMTQFGRYASITKKQLDGYRIIQDTHFSAGGASGGTGRAGEADPVDTHVYLDTPEDRDFARTLLDMGEQTCFLHALCRTDLKPKLTVSSTVAAVG